MAKRKTKHTATPHFLMLTWGDDGKPSIGTSFTVQPMKLLPALMFPSIAELDVADSLSDAMKPPATNGQASRRDLERASGALSALMAIEMRSDASGFAAVLPDGAIRLFFHARELPVNAPMEITDSMKKIADEHRVQISAVGISDADRKFLEGASDRVATQCLFSNIAALLVRMKVTGNGIEAGVREAIRRGNSP